MPRSHARRAMVLLWMVAAVPYLTSCTTSAAPDRPPSVAGRLSDDIADYLERADLTDVRAVIVVADDRTVVEEYYDSTPEDYRSVFSVTKSVVSTLVGIAIDEGLLDLGQPLAQLLPAYASTMTPDVAGTTLEQLLTMTGPFPDTWASGAVTAVEQANPPPDWVAYDLQTANHSPGQGFAYSDPGVDLVPAILAGATGRSVLEYAREKLFTPIGVDTEPAAEPVAVPGNLDAYEAAAFAWPVDPQGIHLGSTLLRLSPRDMAAFGSLYLHEGRANGEQVVSPEWVHEATAAQVPARGASSSYGYLWWTGAEADGAAAYLAWGHGGQLIEIVPERDLVVVISSAVDLRDSAASAMNPSRGTQLVDEVIAPALGD
jgi:CubicO group peptidase (beta-lactamase class C family)